MWLIAEYQPVTLFSFRSGLTTSSGAKTQFLPTPFAVRTALLDAAIRTNGVAAGQMAFDWIKGLSIAARPPAVVVVTNLFAKVLKPARDKEAEEAMGRTIAFREYAYLEGAMALAIDVPEARTNELQALLAQINYFGKRGSFFQLMGVPGTAQQLPSEFVPLNGVYVQGTQVKGEPVHAFVGGLIQVMDDWGEDLTFDKTNVFSDEKIRLGRDRVRKTVILPYRLVRSSKSFSFYQRV